MSHPARLARTIAVPALLALTAHPASAEGFFGAIDGGISDADFGSAVFADGSGVGPLSDDAILVAGLRGGYEWDNNLFVEAGYESYESLAVVLLFESLSVDTFRLAAGYYLPSDSRWRVYGKAGLNFWNLDARESPILNPGPEELASLDGTDLFVEGGLEYRFTEHFAVGLGLSHSRFDEGSATTGKVMFTLRQ